MTSTALPSRLGLSLRNAYQPASETEALSHYNHHRCIACGTDLSGELPPEVSPWQLGQVFFLTLPKPCTCGYTNEVILVLNNLMRNTGSAIPNAEEAIARAIAENLLPDPFLEERLIAANVALHHGKLEEAAAINQALTLRFPQFFLPFHNLGIIYTRQQRYPESLEMCDRALERHPGHLDSLVNKAFVLLQLSRLREAGETYERWRSLKPEGTVVLAEEVGKFGKIEIVDDRETRSLWIDKYPQGRIYKQPTANEWKSGCRSGPGPVSSNLFTAGFLLVGCQKPRALGLVLGLGYGGGLVMNLACFPQMHLTVVEVDPAIVKHSLTFFPLVQHYIDEHRLEIVEADAEVFLRSNQRRFDFLQSDIFQGKPELITKLGLREFVQLLQRTAPLLFVNLIGKLNEPYLHRVLAAFDAVGKPIRALYPAFGIEENEATLMNWLALTEEVVVPDDFVPFTELTGDGVEIFRRNFAQLRQNVVLRETMRSYVKQFDLKIELD